MIEGLKMLPLLMLILGVAAMIGGATALTLSKFRATTSDAAAQAVIDNGTAGIKTIAEQTPTLAIVYVMVIIIGALMSVFAYFKFFG